MEQETVELGELIAALMSSMLEDGLTIDQAEELTCYLLSEQIIQEFDALLEDLCTDMVA